MLKVNYAVYYANLEFREAVKAIVWDHHILSGI